MQVQDVQVVDASGALASRWVKSSGGQEALRWAAYSLECAVNTITPLLDVCVRVCVWKEPGIM